MITLRAEHSPIAPSERIVPNFDPIARVYRWAEYLALGPLLHRTRLHFLKEFTAARQVMVLGDGDGRFAAALLRQAPHAHLGAVDTSKAMLGLLRDRCTRDGNAGRLTITHASALDIQPLPKCDLIATHFFLDCLTQPEVDTLAVQLGTGVQPGCRWVLSEFGLPRSRLARPLAQAYIGFLYFVFGCVTKMRVRGLPDPQHALRLAGFRRLGRWEWLGGFVYSELWQLPG